MKLRRASRHDFTGDYNTVEETVHLLGSPENAKRLRESISEFKAGKTFTKNLLKNDSTEKGQKQRRRGKFKSRL
jgi:antitoxin YefM